MHTVHSCILPTSFLSWLPPEPSFTTSSGGRHRGTLAVFWDPWPRFVRGEVQTAAQAQGSSFHTDSSQKISLIIFGSFKGWRRRRNLEEGGWRWEIRLQIPFSNTMPTSFSVIIKADVELGLKHLLEISSAFGNIYMKVIYSKGHGFWGCVFSELSDSVCRWADPGPQLVPSDSC